MSSVFNSSFVNTPVSSRPRHHKPRSSTLRTLAGWLGLAAGPRADRTAPAVRKSWDQHKLAMLDAGDKMLARSRTDDQPLSLAVFDLDDLPELESVFGARIAREVVAQVVRRLQAMAGSKGVVIRTDATVFSVLMPGSTRDVALRSIERTMGKPCCIELDADQHEIVLIPDFKIHSFRRDSAPLPQVYSDLRRAISEAQQLERRRHRYLQRERESHTRPAELADQTTRA